MRVACSVMGGPAECDYVAEGGDYDELAEDLEDHAYDEHPEVVERMEEMSDEDYDDWVSLLMDMAEE